MQQYLQIFNISTTYDPGILLFISIFCPLLRKSVRIRSEVNGAFCTMFPEEIEEDQRKIMMRWQTR